MSDSSERPMGKLLRFPSRATRRTEHRFDDRLMTPEMVGTVLVYRYYGENGHTYPVDAKAANRFLGYMHMLSQMYGLSVLDGQPDQNGQINEKFVFEQVAEGEVPPEKRFCAVLQLAEEGSVASVSFRMMANRQFGYSPGAPSRLRLVPDTHQ